MVNLRSIHEDQSSGDLRCSGAMPGNAEKNPVVIQPGKFVEEWPTAIRGRLIRHKKCAVDAVNGVEVARQPSISLKRGNMLQLSGWIFSEKDGAPAEIYVQLVGPTLTYTAITHTRTPRPDVNQYFDLGPSMHTGFELQASQNVEPSEYQIKILQPGQAGVAECETRVSIKIE